MRIFTNLSAKNLKCGRIEDWFKKVIEKQTGLLATRLEGCLDNNDKLDLIGTA